MLKRPGWSENGNGHGRRVSRSRRALGLAGLLTLGTLIGGCSTGPNASRAGPIYPDRQQGPTLDIQVVREETHIRMTNTTVTPFTDARLWINQWYSRPVPSFAVGETLEMSLWEFFDQHGEAFQAGGFFASRRPERLVLAQLEAGDDLHGLIVVGRAEE